MEKASANEATLMSSLPQISAIRVTDFRETRVRIMVQIDNRRVVEFVTHDDGVRGPKRTVPEQTRDAVAEMELAFGDACLGRQEVRHGMHAALVVLEGPPQYHVAAALPVNRPARGKAPKPLQEAARIRDPLCMKLGVAAG